jgi:hypothetical protein
MLRVLRSIVIMWLAIAALIGSALLIGRAKPPRDNFRALGFDMCDGRLCFRGITPDVTKGSEARGILRKLATSYSPIVDRYFIGQIRIEMDVDPQTDIVGNLQIMNGTPVPLAINIADFVQRRGLPCGIWLNEGSVGDLNFIFAHERVLIKSPHLRITPSTPIEMIEITNEPANCGIGRSWPGFTTFQRYREFYLRLSK